MTWHFVRLESKCVTDTATLYAEHFKCFLIVFFSVCNVLCTILKSQHATKPQTGMSQGGLDNCQTQKLKWF